MTKRAIPTLLLIFFAVFLNGQHSVVSDAVRIDGVITTQDLQPAEQSIHPVAARAISRGERPGTFANVRYSFAPNVKVLSQTQKSKIRLLQDGILDLGAGAFRPDPDTVYIDSSSDLVLQAEPVDDTRMLALRPSLDAVFTDIDVPEQVVPVTLANTVSMAEGIVESASRSGDTYAVNLQFDSLVVTIDSTKDGSLKAALVGQVLITDPRIEGKYSRNNGYRLAFLASEQVDLKVYATVEAKKEIKKPIWGTEMKISDLGKCELGLFLLINMEGKVSLSFEIHQGINMELGARGGTFWYVPTSIHNISTVDHWCDIDYNVMARLKAFAGLQVTANLKVKGYNALDLYVNGGMEGTVESDAVTLDADVGFRIKAGGKVVSKKFTLVDKYYSLWKIQKPDYQGYDMVVHEACAWGDYVVGEIRSITESSSAPGLMDTVAYNGALTVVVTHPGNQKNEYAATTDADGIFAISDVPLKKGDKVAIRLPGVNNPSPAVDATIPFKEVTLYAADYYAGIAEGAVAGRKSKWARLASRQEASASPSPAAAAAAAAAGNTQAERLKQMMPHQETLKRIEDFRNSLIVYHGQIEFITQRAPQPVLKGAGPQGTRMMSQQKVTSDKSLPNRGMVSSPLGTFHVSGLSFEPGQKVKARIVTEGFTVESDWVETDGLFVSAIEYEGLDKSVRPGQETISAANSFVVVSAIRSETAPAGTVTMVKGAGAPHSSLTGSQQVPEFPTATKAKVWFRKGVPLTSLPDHPGMAIARTGQWSVTYGYSSPGDALMPMKNRKHPFELVSYTYKDIDLGYSSFIDECASCTSPLNILDKLGSSPRPGSFDRLNVPVNIQKAPVPMQQQKFTTPAVMR